MVARNYHSCTTNILIVKTVYISVNIIVHFISFSVFTFITLVSLFPVPLHFFTPSILHFTSSIFDFLHILCWHLKILIAMKIYLIAPNFVIQFQSSFILKFDHHKGAVRRYPNKGACALKWEAPLCGPKGYAA